MKFFAELKRRNVYRVAVLYVIISWLILQVVDVFTSFMPLPDWTARLVFLLLLIGFPLALVFAWAFELTPEGIRKEGGSSDGTSAQRVGGKKASLLIYAMVIVVAAYFAWQYFGSKEPETPVPVEIRSLVVLPFEDLMNDPGQTYFVAGMHEAVISELSRIEALRVISRTSAARFEDSGKSVPEIARELGVEAVVEGSVLKAGDTVRINVQLIDAKTDRHLWAETFDRQLSDILALYADVTTEIASRIRITLSADQRAQLSSVGQVVPEAYELYLEGRFLCDNWSPQEMRQGIERLERVLQIDPDNVPALAHLALCLQYSAFFGYHPPLEVHDRSMSAAKRAVQLDGKYAEAYVALAGIQYYLEFDPKAAMKSLQKALELDPSNVRALMHASWLYGEAGIFTKAFEFNRRAIELDPLSVLVTHAMGQLYFLGRDYENAILQTRKALNLDPNDPSMHYFLALPFEQQERYDEAREALQRAIVLSEGAPLYRAALAHTFGKAGLRESATQILDELLVQESTPPFAIALAYLGLGDDEQALDWLEKSLDAMDSQIIYINRDPRFDSLRAEPRFIRMLEKIDYPPGDTPLGSG